MNNQRKIWALLSLALILLGLGMIFFHLWHPYQLVVDGQPLQVRTIAFSLRGLLRQLNYESSLKTAPPSTRTLSRSTCLSAGTSSAPASWKSPLEARN